MKTPSIASFLGLAALLALAGCVTTPTAIDPTQSARKSLITPADIIPDAHLSPALACMENDVKSLSIPFRSQTGKVLSQIFTGGADARCQMDLVSSSMTASSSDFALVMNKTQIFFTLSVVVRVDHGPKQVLSATGMGSTVGFPALAMREAAERAALDLAKQVRIVVSP
jgi:hypothetical protein